MAQGGQNMPMPEGYDWMNYPGAGGKPNLNPWSDPFYDNLNNFWASKGMAGGYDPAATYGIWQNQVMPGMMEMSNQATRPYNDMMFQNARGLIQGSMEDIGASLGTGVYGGAFGKLAQDKSSELALQAGMAGEQARLGLLSGWSNQSLAQLPSMYQDMWKTQAGFAAPEWVAPVVTPRYGEQNQGLFNGGSWDWGGMGQGALAGAGIGAAFGGVGALIGGGLGGLMGAFGWI
jgi:hypothetical protein